MKIRGVQHFINFYKHKKTLKSKALKHNFNCSHCRLRITKKKDIKQTKSKMLKKMIGEKSPACDEGHKYPPKIVISTKAPSPTMAPFDLSPVGY